ncbi:TonB-dependent receptor domain-containing protein [Povalibacter sp.]|uniref:TonB-dependent receptor domain-containing protein n=1 Tax=Povalibacter sp. TaxID=1962978 RepID=UPI002F42E164
MQKLTIAGQNSLVVGAAALLTLMVTGASDSKAQDVAADGVVHEVVVTGSRLRRDDLSAPSPTIIMSSQEIQMSGRGTLEGMLNELPQVNPDTGATTSNIGQAGLHTADLRGLRPERTLVLVNGKRFTPANESGLVDLSRIPSALVERVEVTTGGASAVYGSDAIAGAVNFIMRKDIDGLEVKYDYGQTFESDGETQKLDILFGTDFAGGRGNMVLHAGVYDQKSVVFQDRDFSRINIDVRNGRLVPAGTSNNPGTSFFLTPTQINQLVGVDLADFTTDRDYSSGGAGSCTQVQGIRFGRDGVPLPYCDPQDRFNYNTGNYMMRPYKSHSISALADYAINDSISAYTELFYTNNQNSWNLNVASFMPQTSGYNSLLLPNYAINPVLFPATRDFLVSNAAIFDPDGDGNAQIFAAGRNLAEGGYRNYSYDNSSYSMTGGLRGKVPFVGGDWQWDSFYQVQKATEAQNQTGGVSPLRMSLGLDVVVDPVTGVARCRNAYSGCIPINLLGIEAATPEMLAFLTPEKGDQEYFNRDVFQISTNGTLFNLPAGPVATAIGFEWREQGYRFLPGGLNESGPQGSQQPRIDASTDVWEVFTEARVPIIADVPGIDSLTLELAYRYSDYSTSGGVGTYKGGLEYAPVDWLRFRSAYNRAVRAPNLRELYAPQTRGFEGGEDPCDSELNPSQAVQDFCVLTGVPADTIANFVPSVDLSGRRGGNPNLVPEESDTITVGFVASPSFIPDFHLTVDYFNIEVNDSISTVTAETMLQTCYTLLDINHPSCRAVTRLPNGLVYEVLALSSNIATFEVNGLDVAFDYSMGLPDFMGIGTNGAAFKFRGLFGWMFERKSQQIDIAPVVDCAGKMGTNCSGFGNRPIPDFTAKIDFRYVSGDLSLGATLRHIGEFGFVDGDARAAVFNGKVAAENYWDLDASYNLRDSLNLHAVIKNVNDGQPTVLGQGLAGDAGVDVGLYDVLGRRFMVGFNYKFN